MRWIEAVIGKALHRLIFASLIGIAQFRQRLQRRVEVAGHVDFGDDGNGQVIGQGHDVAHHGLGIIAASRLRARAEQRRQRLAVAAPGGDFGQRGIGVDLEPPGFVLGEMPMELVQLVPGHDADQAADFRPGIELARHVEMGAAKGKAGFIIDGAAGRPGEGRRIVPCAAQHVAEGHEAIKQPGMGGGGDSGAIVAEGDFVGLAAQPGLLGDIDGHAALGGRADNGFDREQFGGEIGKGVGSADRQIAFRLEVETHRGNAVAAGVDMFGPGDDRMADRRFGGNREARRALEQRSIMPLALGRGRRNGNQATIIEHNISRIGAVAPMAQAIGKAARRCRPGLAGFEHKALGRRDQRVVGEALQQSAVFERCMRIDTRRPRKAQLEIADRLVAGIGQLDAITERFAVRCGRPGGDEGKRHYRGPSETDFLFIVIARLDRAIHGPAHAAPPHGSPGQAG